MASAVSSQSDSVARGVSVLIVRRCSTFLGIIQRKVEHLLVAQLRRRRMTNAAEPIATTPRPATTHPNGKPPADSCGALSGAPARSAGRIAAGGHS